VPAIVFARLDESFGRTEPDAEIQDLLKASTGLNLASHFLSGALTFDPAATTADPLLASRIVWLDGLLMNVDRTARNTNMLLWNREIWLIDQGAALYFHHSWDNWEDQAIKPFVQIKDHVLLKYASRLEEVDAEWRRTLTPAAIRQIVSLIPDEWLLGSDDFGRGNTPGSVREIYAFFLEKRIESSAIFLNEAQHARERFV